ncbi:MAG: hypothetical protein J2P30_23620 [Actinobacteria bacterium]|nr:hypothetical protein [Actinomycetota bacterium]
MTAMMRVPRTRGVGSGLVLILLGAWGALIPFIGPYFHFAYTPDAAWTWTWGRFFLEIVPGVATALGGLILMISAFRPAAMFGAALAAAGGAWFAVGSLLGPVWASYSGGVPRALNPGLPTGGPLRMVAEHLSFFIALGVVIVFFAALALGRLAVIGTRDAQLATGEEAARARRHARADEAPEREPASEEGERPSVWRRLTTTR